MAFAVPTQDGSIGINHDNRIEKVVQVPLKDADGQNHPKLACQDLGAKHRLVGLIGLGHLHVLAALLNAKVRPFKEFR